MAQHIAQVVVFVLIALPFAYMAFDVAREISTQLVKKAESRLIPIKAKRESVYQNHK